MIDTSTPSLVGSIPCPSLDAVEPTVNPQTPTRAYNHWDSEKIHLHFRHSGWKPLREQVLAGFRRADVPQSRIQRFRECGTHAWVLQDDNDPSRFKLAGSYCHDRFCVPCATERSRRVGRVVREYLGEHPVRFITLTLKHSDDPLADQLQRLTASFRKLRQRKLWVNRVDGGLACIEVKYSASAGKWHPHLHIIAEGRYIDQAELSAAWNGCTGDSFIVDVRFVKDPQIVSRYVAKYASKPMTKTYAASPAAMAEAIEALHGKRLIIVFGTWSDLDLDSDSDDTTWHCFRLLSDVIYDARDGDRFAQAVIEHLRKVSPCPPENVLRPP